MFETANSHEAIDVSRLSEGVTLSTAVSNEIHAKALEESLFQNVAQRVDIPTTGESYQIITGEPEAGWVGETEEKPVSRPTFENGFWQPYKSAVIVPFSDEFKRDSARLFSEVQRRIPRALSRLFDRTVLGLADTPGQYFDRFDGVQSVELDLSSYEAATDSLLNAEELISDADGWLTDYLLEPKARVALMRVRDSNGDAVFTNGQNVTDGRLMGAPVTFHRVLGEADVRGYAVDAGALEWGVASGVQLSMSTESTLTETLEDGTTRTLNLWQRNMFALRAEIEIAFRADKTKVVALNAAAA